MTTKYLQGQGYNKRCIIFRFLDLSLIIIIKSHGPNFVPEGHHKAPSSIQKCRNAWDKSSSHSFSIIILYSQCTRMLCDNQINFSVFCFHSRRFQWSNVSYLQALELWTISVPHHIGSIQRLLELPVSQDFRPPPLISPPGGGGALGISPPIRKFAPFRNLTFSLGFSSSVQNFALPITVAWDNYYMALII